MDNQTIIFYYLRHCIFLLLFLPELDLKIKALRFRKCLYVSGLKFYYLLIKRTKYAYRSEKQFVDMLKRE